MKIHNQKGVALITALLLGLVGTLLVGAAWFLLSRSNSMITQSNQYAMELDTASGVGELIMATIRKDDVTCETSGADSGLPCTNNCVDGGCEIELNQNLCEALGKIWTSGSCESLNVIYQGTRSSTAFCIVDGSQEQTSTTIHSFTVTSANENSISTVAPEQAIIDIVYKEVIDNCN